MMEDNKAESWEENVRAVEEGGGIVFDLRDCHGIYVFVSFDEDGNRSGRIGSNLKVDPPQDEEDEELNSLIDVVESFILAMACAGIGIDTPAMRTAIETTVEAIGNNF